MSQRIRFAFKMAAVAALLGLVTAGGIVVWLKFFKTEARSFDNDLERFKYGSLGGEAIVGIPYPLFMILPRVFPDLVEKYAAAGFGPEKFGHGGYEAFGLAWEEGKQLPIGLSIKHVGYDRVTVNCAVCHTASYRTKPDAVPCFAVGGPGHTVNMQGLLRFLFAAANDDRFTALRLMPELALQFKFDWADWPLYAFVLIPGTRAALHLAERQLQWMDQKTAWAPGRDDAFNLPKFVLTQSPWDDSIGNTDFPALWGVADHDGRLFHAGGEAKTVYAIVATSALGVGSLPDAGFEERNRWLENFIRTLAPPKYPATIDEAAAAHGKELFTAHCASCHAEDGARTGTAVPIDEIQTDPERLRTWTQRDADRMNRLTRTLGMRGAELQGAQGYVAKPLIGVWLLGPYLHNGSVPTLSDLLSPPERRPPVFYRGYDVIDFDKVGFVSTGPKAIAKGFEFRTSDRGNGNGGHLYGTDLSDTDKRALIEYLKTL
jgi:mono/diheme cytochrome c family protein